MINMFSKKEGDGNKKIKVIAKIAIKSKEKEERHRVLPCKRN